MNLLTICQDILKETKSSYIPSLIIGNIDDVAIQIYQTIKVSIIELSRTYQWQELQKEHTFASVVSQAEYNLPSDFDRMINDTFWNKDQQWNLIGPITSENWRILKDSTVSSANIREYYRIRNNQVIIHEVPSVIENYVYEYISKNIVKSVGNVAQTEFLSDTDVSIIDPYILRLDATWRWLKNNGRAFKDEQNIAKEAITERIGINGSRAKIFYPSKDIINAQISAFKPIVYA